MEPSALNLEITESVVLGNTEDTISKMSELKQLGISFSVMILLSVTLRWAT